MFGVYGSELGSVEVLLIVTEVWVALGVDREVVLMIDG